MGWKEPISLAYAATLARDTLGLMLLTNNGPLSHRLLAPRSHVAKSYRFAVSGPLGQRGGPSRGMGHKVRIQKYF